MDLHPYYTNTCQCKYYYRGEWRFGIVYHSIVIDAEDGEPRMTEPLAIAAALDGLDDWICELNWVDLRRNFISKGYRI